MKKNAIVIGSGISGLSISRMLQDKFAVTVLEKTDQTGGLIKCKRINGNLFHLVGGHVFNSKNDAVLEWFWSYFDRDKEFLKTARNAKIFLKDQFIGYPIENFIYQLPEEHIQCIIKDLLQIAVGKTDLASKTNFEFFLKESFGKTLYDIYFGPYNTKLWNTDLSSIPLEWLSGKLPMPEIQDILINNILKKAEEKMVHSTFYYPVRDGSQFIINRIAQGLDIHLSYEITSISQENGRLSVNEGDKSSDYLVYCGDVRKLHSIMHIADKVLCDALEAVKDLHSNGTSNVLCETDETDISWLYLPEKKFLAHRIIYTGNFSKTNNEGTGRKTCVVEFAGRKDKNEMLEEIKMLPGNLVALDFNFEPNSYIIHKSDTRDKIHALKTQLAKYNIFLLGRFAEWEYYNMDKCIESAMELNTVLSEKEILR
jgi:protoporphyrinogen oxidase